MRKTTLLVILLSGYYIVNAQWQQTAGPTGTIVNCFAALGSSLYAGTNGGIYVSNDNGATWSSSKTGLTSVNVTSLAANGVDLFTGTVGGIFKSSDQGLSWSSTNAGLADLNILTLTVSGTNIFAGTASKGVYVSSNNGANWTIANNGLPTAQSGVSASLLASIGGNVFVETEAYGPYGSFAGGLSILTNYGANWQPINNGLPVTEYGPMVQALAGKDSFLFAGTHTGVFRSFNNGSSWIEVDSGLTNKNIHAFAATGSTLFAGTDNGVFRSQDNGLTWATANLGMTSIPVCSLIIKDTCLFAGTTFSAPYKPGDIYYSSNNGASWTALNTRFPDLQVNAMLVNGANIIAGTNAGVFVSSDNGITWNEISTGIVNKYITSLSAKDTCLFAGTLGGGIYRSTDNGNNWIPMNNGFPQNDNLILSLKTYGSNIYAGSCGNLYFSSDNGTNWSPLYSACCGLEDVRAFVVSGTNLITAGNNGIVTYPNCTPNSGMLGTQNWTYFDGNTFTCLAMQGSTVFAGGVGGILVSHDSGTTWSYSNAGISYLTVWSLYADGQRVYAGTENGIFISYDNGANWVAVTAITDMTTYAFVKNGATLFAGTNISVWEITEPLTVQQSAYQTLINIYPNPSSGSIKMDFKNELSDIKIGIFDVLGNCLLNKQYYQDQKLEIDISGRPKGVYFAVIEYGKEKEVHKIIFE